MPLNEDVTRYTNQRAWAFFPDHDMRMGLGNWLDQKGRSTYAKYLATRPFETIFAPVEHWKTILAYQHSLAHLAYLYDSEDSPNWQINLSALLFPQSIIFPILTLLTVVILAVNLFYRRDDRLLFPILLLLSVYFLAMIAWHGDADSIERHAFQATLLVRLATWIAPLILLDMLLSTEQNLPH